MQDIKKSPDEGSITILYKLGELCTFGQKQGGHDNEYPGQCRNPPAAQTKVTTSRHGPVLTFRLTSCRATRSGGSARAAWACCRCPPAARRSYSRASAGAPGRYRSPRASRALAAGRCPRGEWEERAPRPGTCSESTPPPSYWGWRGGKGEVRGGVQHHRDGQSGLTSLGG